MTHSTAEKKSSSSSSEKKSSSSSSEKKSSPEKKSPVKDEKKAKPKQGGVMSFFAKQGNKTKYLRQHVHSRNRKDVLVMIYLIFIILKNTEF